MLRRVSLRKLSLHKETIRELSALRFSAIKGGEARISPVPCPVSPDTCIFTCTSEAAC